MPADVEWVRFTKRTEDPKLACLERQLRHAGIPCRRNGASWHAPILEVPEERLEDAWKILRPVDEIDDDDEMFIEFYDVFPMSEGFSDEEKDGHEGNDHMRTRKENE